MFNGTSSSFFIFDCSQERKVHRLINQSALAVAKNDLISSLDIAKDAAKKERALCKYRESKGLTARVSSYIFSIYFTIIYVQVKSYFYVLTFY